MGVGLRALRITPGPGRDWHRRRDIRRLGPVNFALSLTAFLAGSAVVYADDAGRLLRECTALLSAADHSSYRFTTDLVDERANRTVHQFIEADVLRAGRLMNYEGFYRFPDTPDKSWRFREVTDENRMMKYLVKKNDSSDLLGPPKNGVTSEKILERVRWVRRYPQYGGFLDGYFSSSGDMRFTELLLNSQDARVLDREEEFGERVCSVVEGRCDFGEITLWIAKDEPHTLHRVEYLKGTGDLLEGNQVVGEPPTDENAGFPKSWRIVVDGLEHQVIDGKPVCASGVLTLTVERMDGKTETQTYRSRREGIVLNPSFDADAFQIDLPEGVPVTHWDHQDSGLRFVWRNGNVERANADFVTPVTERFTGARSTGLWLFVANGIALLLLGGWLLVKSRRSSSK